MAEYNERLCSKTHERIDEKIETAERRLNDHSKRQDKTELVVGRLEERMDSLIKQLTSLNTTMRWFMGLLIGALVSFFFYAVQQGVFR